MTGEEVVNAMAEAFEGAKGPLCWRILAALEAGEKAGGDKRGKQSAAVLVVRTAGRWGPTTATSTSAWTITPKPIRELARILALRVPDLPGGEPCPS